MTKRFLGLVSLLLVALHPVHAAEITAGVDYDLVKPPQPTADPSKIEVLEFFWYGCPHCFHFEPELNAWTKTVPANVDFRRQPAIFNEQWAAHAKAFYTAETLGVLDKLHADFYDAIQNKKESLTSEDDLATFFKAHGIDEAAFHKAYKSFAVDSQMRQAEGLAAKYGITGTPALVINGKYVVSPGKAKSFPRMIEITNALIRQESGSAESPQEAAKPATSKKKAH